jgi:hypothetical protein
MGQNEITNPEMIAAIQNSGYLIEQRVEWHLLLEGYSVQTSDAYLDSETGKNREVDITAIKGESVLGKNEHFITFQLIIECENNSQPVVFFRNNQTSEFRYDEIKLSGIPIKVTVDNSILPIDEYLRFDSFHHYGSSSNYTQYCSFQQVGKGKELRWIASHLENQHDSFSNLIKCLEFKCETLFANQVWPMEGFENALNLHLFYPIVVLQGKLYEASESEDNVNLTEKKWLTFRKQVIRNQKISSYKIDVVAEEFLPNFLKVLEKEKASMFDEIRNNWQQITLSMLVKTQKARQMKTHREAYGLRYQGE